MSITKILVANRGEIAVRIMRSAADACLATVAVYARDDAESLHVRMADESVALDTEGPAAYLDIERLMTIARETRCDAIHPGYGFLSENARFAKRAEEAGLRFIGPRAELLELFGNKSRARQLAEQCGIPVLAGTAGATSLDEASAFLDSLPPGQAIMVKAIAGGGGRGMRIARTRQELETAFRACEQEARHAFGSGELYVEQLLPHARHIEVQIVGDGRHVMHLGERECTIQRRNQKIIEMAPSPSLSEAMRDTLRQAAVSMAAAVSYNGLATFEFLVPATSAGEDREFAFLEVNPRLQVEHTVTEQIYGIDLVKIQFMLAASASLADIGLSAIKPVPQGCAMQLRINMETIGADGTTRPSGGTLTAFDLPSGPGIRVDTFGYGGYTPSPRYDSLLAKLIVHSPSPHYQDLVRRAGRALAEFRIEGISTNIPLLQSLLDHEDFRENRIDTRFIDTHIDALLETGQGNRQQRYFSGSPPSGQASERGLRSNDPLGVFAAAPSDSTATPPRARSGSLPMQEGAIAIEAPMQGTIVEVCVAAGGQIKAGQPMIILEAMKMQHLMTAPRSGIVLSVEAAAGETVFEGERLAQLLPADADDADALAADTLDLDLIRRDLDEVLARHGALQDASRPDAVARRRKTGQRTLRENIADLCDAESFVEYGGLALATQRRRRSFEELLTLSPADGMVTGVGRVNGALFPDDAARCAVMGYDYTVFAGTQGVTNHKKTDRILDLAEKWRLPVFLFAEGGGGRPGDEWPTPAGLDTSTFTRMGALAGVVPTIGIVSGRCFAGNAALLGSADVIIATENTNIGMGGPAMIEGGGLGVYAPEEIGPLDVQVPNGVVDIVVRDEAEAVAIGKQYLSYFQGRLNDWQAADQRLLRHAVPENRLRAYDIRGVIDVLADTGSVLELRPRFGQGMVTALIRLEGRPVGLMANNSHHLGGAIDADAADKAARFIRLCDVYGLPVISLCDTPGMMVGPEAEKTAQVRHVSRMFIAASSATVPFFSVVLRKGYGLGALAMVGGNTRASFMTLAWPTGEFGAMGLEGGVKLAYRKELAAIEDVNERKAWFDMMVAKSYEENKALSSASFLEVDDVIDPATTRFCLVQGLRSLPVTPRSTDKKHAPLDVW